MKIAFGSCNRQWRSQAHWDLIASHKPDLWIWLGDMIYSDFSTMNRRKRTYDELKANPYYARFREQVPIIGTWDDHDYAYNNKDGTYRNKEKSKALALDFLDMPPGPKRSGIYSVHRWPNQNPTVTVLMLDLRYNQDKKKGLLLGNEQWAWLEYVLKEWQSGVFIIGSSLNTGYGWHNFPNEQKRLYSLLETVDSNVVVISGDRHMGEFCKLPTSKPIYEVMSSGLTHNRNGQASPHALETFREPNFGILSIGEQGAVGALYSSLDGDLIHVRKVAG